MYGHPGLMFVSVWIRHKKRQPADAGELPFLLIYYQSNLICLLYELAAVALVSVSIFVIIIVAGVGFIGPARSALVATVKTAVAE